MEVCQSKVTELSLFLHALSQDSVYLLNSNCWICVYFCSHISFSMIQTKNFVKSLESSWTELPWQFSKRACHYSKCSGNCRNKAFSFHSSNWRDVV